MAVHSRIGNLWPQNPFAVLGIILPSVKKIKFGTGIVAS